MAYGRPATPWSPPRITVALRLVRPSVVTPVPSRCLLDPSINEPSLTRRRRDDGHLPAVVDERGGETGTRRCATGAAQTTRARDRLIGATPAGCGPRPLVCPR